MVPMVSLLQTSRLRCLLEYQLLGLWLSLRITYFEKMAGNTAIREVIDDASPDMIKLLLEAGADPTIPGFMGITATRDAEDRFKQRGDKESAEILRLVQGGRI